MQKSKVKLNGGFQNEVFHIQGKGKVLRISGMHKTEKMIKQEIEWMIYLHNAGLAVPLPDVNLDISNGRVGTFFEYIEGNQVDVTNHSHWNLKTFKEFGRILGKMHAVSKEYEVVEIYRPVWTKEDPDVFDLKNSLNDEMRRIYESLLQDLLPYSITKDTYGLIHNDFHQGNLIVNNTGNIVVIDFDDCSFNWFAQDIAVFFYHAYWQQDSFNGMLDQFGHEFMHHFFAGYQEENTLHETTIKQIPTFLKLREVFLYRLFREKWDLTQLEEWQKYTLDDLERKITNQLPFGGITDFSDYLS
ncbi:phosphotransferase [Mesobacillus subterraneus]|uniref:phosphotransferase enzyme family protein n=1 Tax=Mesobacillus subterraneus TaxID=285983 RepID=UPI00203C20E2|nr:phosphotransferase [Mesobacillus subterraneus]MCM3575305.1 phosphotransferase [Mesobacillus subterraneus]